MKKQLFLLFTATIFASLFITSCTEDDPLNPGPGLSPSVRLMDAGGFISTSTTAESGALLSFRVTASAGDDLLDRFTIKENGTNVPLGRITFEAGSSFGANPVLLLGADNKQGFTEDIQIDGPTSPGNYEYQFEVRDEAGEVSTTSVTVSVELVPPALTLIDPTSALEVGPGSRNTITVDALPGTADLATIGVYENGVLMDASRLNYDDNGFLPFINNPETTPDIAAFQAGIAIDVSETPDSVPYTYRIELTDAEGLTSSVNVEVLVIETIDTTYTGVLVYNKDGEQFGGLNLYTGESVPFNSANAQIRDLGIDLNLPLASNWIQKIRATNGAELRVPGNNQVEGFSFENTNSRDVLITAYENGQTIEDSDKVMVDDIFLVKNGDDYFILKVTDVVVTLADNNDYYEFSIKKSEL